MTKILTEVPCTNCGSNHQAVIDLDEITRRIQERPAKEVVKEIVKPYDFEPNAFCTNGSCTTNHHAGMYKQRVTKKCTNCGQFAPTKAAKCAWCGSNGIDEAEDRFEELDDEYLDEIGVPRPEMPASYDGSGHHHHD
jgi:hypothetical protein